MHDVENVVNDGAFWVALAVSALGTAIVWLRLRARHHEPGVLVVVTLACLVGLRVDSNLPASLYVGLALLLLGDWMARALPMAARAVVAVPGALVLGAALPLGWPFWIRAVVSVSTVVGGVLVDATDRVLPRLVPTLLAIGAVGVYLCVPDTETPKALVGALVVGAVLGADAHVWPTIGATALTGLFVSIAGFGGAGRPGSVVGGVACLGVAVLIPMLGTRRFSRRSVVVIVAVQLVLVVFASRVAGFEQSAWSALALCVPAFAGAGLVLASTTHDRRGPASSA